MDMSIEQVLLILTLLVTITGWAIIYRFQRRILERQIEAEDARISREWVAPKRISRLADLREWLVAGQRLFYSLENEKLEIRKIEDQYEYVIIDQSDRIDELALSMREWITSAWAFQNWMRSEGMKQLQESVGSFVRLMDKFSDTKGQEAALDLWEDGGRHIEDCFREIERLIKQEAAQR